MIILTNNHHLLMELQGGRQEVPQEGGYPLYMKNFYGLELLKNLDKWKKWFFAPADTPPLENDKNYFFNPPLITRLNFLIDAIQQWLQAEQYLSLMLNWL